MVNAGASYLHSFPLPATSAQAGPPRLNRDRAFFASLLVLAVLDVCLFLAVFKPWNRPSNDAQLSAAQVEQVAVGDSLNKPSPVGPRYVAKAKLAARR